MKPARPHAGFSLTEMAIVLVIVSLLVGGLLIPFGAQNDSRMVAETQRTLNDIREALVGYAAANGRLPCPTTSAGTSGSEAFAGAVGASACSNPYDGYVPGQTLGIGPTDTTGIPIDAWGNKIRYAVTTANTNAFTTSSGMKTATIATLAPDINVCTTATGISASSCNTATALSSNAVAIIYSTGKNTANGGTGADEAANLNGDPVFVSHEPAPADGGNEFDDVVIWLSPNILYNRLIAAGQLP